MNFSWESNSRTTMPWIIIKTLKKNNLSQIQDILALLLTNITIYEVIQVPPSSCLYSVFDLILFRNRQTEACSLALLPSVLPAFIGANCIGRRKFNKNKSGSSFILKFIFSEKTELLDKKEGSLQSCTFSLKRDIRWIYDI